MLIARDHAIRNVVSLSQGYCRQGWNDHAELEIVVIRAVVVHGGSLLGGNWLTEISFIALCIPNASQ